MAAANRDLSEARGKLAELPKKLNENEEQLNILKQQYDEAVEAKMKCQAQADTTNLKINLAYRLVDGLASEKIRWKELVNSYEASTVTLPGDIILVTDFISYIGCFSRSYRVDLMEKFWRPFLKS